jgi:uncharacterized membrane protein
MAGVTRAMRLITNWKRLKREFKEEGCVEEGILLSIEDSREFANEIRSQELFKKFKSLQTDAKIVRRTFATSSIVRPSAGTAAAQ